MAASLDDKRIALVLKPIAGSGIGDDARNDPLYEAVQAQIDLLGSIGAGGVDWRLIKSNSLTLLERKTKDLRLAAYLVLALLYTERQSGLAVGLAILDGLVRDFWDGIYPKRVPARLAALSMVGERAALVVQHTEPSSGDIAPVAQVQEQLASLRVRLEAVAAEALRAREDDGDGGLNPLWGRLQDYKARLAVLIPTPAADPVQVDMSDQQEAAKEATAQSSPSPTMETKPKPEQLASPPVPPAAPRPPDLTAFPIWTREEATRLRAANLADSRSYLLLRLGEWLTFDGLALNDGRLHGNGPPAHRRAALAALYAGGQFAELINEAEQALAGRPLWLDLHRYTDQGLQGLGKKHEPAQRAVRGAVAMLLVRLPDLLTARFADGAVVADPETQAWIAQFMGSKAAATTMDPMAELLTTASGLRARGEMKAALALFAASGAKGYGRDRFRLLLAQARFAFEGGLIGIVLPIIDDLCAEAMRLGLECWEPPLAAELHRLACQCLTHADATKIRPDPDRRAALVSHRARLFRVDPAAALEFAKF